MFADVAGASQCVGSRFSVLAFFPPHSFPGLIFGSWGHPGCLFYRVS